MSDERDQARSLTDSDVDAIAAKVLQQLLERFQIEAGRGVLGFAKKALVVVLILLAIQGISGDRTVIETFIPGGK